MDKKTYINKNKQANIRVVALMLSKCRKQNAFNSEQVTAGRRRLHADSCNEELRENDKTQRLYRNKAMGKETRERKNG